MDVDEHMAQRSTRKRGKSPVAGPSKGASTANGRGRSKTPEPAGKKTRTMSASPSRRGRASALSRAPRPGLNALPVPEAAVRSAKDATVILPRYLFVFGNGDMGQHGLGTGELGEIKRPRLHIGWKSKVDEGISGQGGLETLAAGGMHTLAVDSDGQIWSWGINDNASLGRSTTRDSSIEAEVLETEPMRVEGLDPAGRGVLPGPPPEGGKEGEVELFRAVQVAAGDSVSVAIGDQGQVRVWGSFRSNDGLLGFDGRTGSEKKQFSPVSLPELNKHSFVQIACGADHVLALTTTGHVYTWGNGQQNQLGRRIIERRKINGLTPERLALKDIVMLGSGSYHSFAVDKKGEVYSWGLNSLHQTGVPMSHGGAQDIIPVPARVEALSPEKHGGARVKQISGGEHHTLFLLDNGEVWGCGRCDGFELGLDDDHPAMIEVAEEREKWEKRRAEELEEEMKQWEAKQAQKREKASASGGADAMEVDGMGGAFAGVVSSDDLPPTKGPPPDEYIPEPVHIPFPAEADGKPTKIVHLASGTRHNLAVAEDGCLYGWGYGNQCQLGIGDEEEVRTPTRVTSKQMQGYKVVRCATGGQHSAVLAVKVDE